jgi:hypothetical protein
MFRLGKLALIAAALLAGAGPASANMRYDNPRMNGATVDWCASWATNCGWGGARQFCQMRGHPNAVSWNVYRAGRTWVIGSSRHCQGPECQGFSQVTCATASGPGPGPGPGPVDPGYGQGRRFHNPQMNGAIVDWCASWAANCGWGGAHQLCRNYGYARAASWNVYRPGRTWVIGTSQFCDGPNCQGFSQVTCRRY